MKTLRLVLLGCAAAGIAGLSASARAPAPPRKEAAYREKIVGTWELMKSADGVKGAVVEFARDGTFRLSFPAPDRQTLTIEGTYEVDGDRLTITARGVGDDKPRKESGTILRVTDTDLVTRDDKGKVDEFRKK